MCFYCGCRELPLIREFITEHERATDLAHAADAALEHGEPAEATELLAELRRALLAHWRGEEAGLFTVMRRYPEYEDYIADLEREHRDLDTLLQTADPASPADRSRLLEAITELHEHITKEEDGLFPASLTALSGADWDFAIEAWQGGSGGARESAGAVESGRSGELDEPGGGPGRDAAPDQTAG